MNESFTIGFIGDVMLGRGVNEMIVKYADREQPFSSAASFWSDVLPTLTEADAIIANLECAISTHTQLCRRTPKVFHFRADPVAVEVLRAGNIRCVSLANNHSLDFDDQGLLDTLHYLDAAAIHHAGAGGNLHDAIAPALMTIGGTTVGVIAVTDNESSFAAEHDRPGTFYLDLSAAPEVLAVVQSSVNQARQLGAQLVILSAHWGPNMVTTPAPHLREFARAAIDSGVDLVYGHSAHVCQAVERYRDRLILYSTGDFLDDYAVDQHLHNDWSFVFLVTFRNTQIERLRLIPVRLRYAQVELARGQEFAEICARMRSLCAEMGTSIQEIPEGLELLVAKPVHT